MAKVNKGTYKIEFYTHLELIKKRYSEGMVVAKALYDELVSAGKITMTYNRFSQYFRTTFGDSYAVRTPKEKLDTALETTDNINKAEPEKEHKPIQLRVEVGKKMHYNPHARGIDPDRILNKRKR